MMPQTFSGCLNNPKSSCVKLLRLEMKFGQNKNAHHSQCGSLPRMAGHRGPLVFLQWQLQFVQVTSGHISKKSWAEVLVLAIIEEPCKTHPHPHWLQAEMYFLPSEGATPLGLTPNFPSSVPIHHGFLQIRSLWTYPGVDGFGLLSEGGQQSAWPSDHGALLFRKGHPTPLCGS